MKIFQRIRHLGKVAFDKAWRIYLRSRNRNKDFSLICPNCIGGTIYNRLGLQFQSPTINLFMSRNDFIKLANNLRHYMEAPIKFVESEFDFPVGMIDDITLYFNHDTKESEAEEKWTRRKKRINYEHVYVLMYEDRPFTRAEAIALQEIPCTRLLVLTSFDQNLDLPYMKRMHPKNKGLPDEAYFLDKDLFGIRTFEKQFDFVAWLNGSDRF